MKKFFLLLGLFALQSVYATDSPKPNQQIEKELSELTQKVCALKSFTANFKQKDKDPLFMDETESEGKITFLKKFSVKGETNCLVRFDYQKPEESTTIMTPHAMIIYTKDMVEPQISPVAGENSADVLFSTFVTPQQLKNHYSIAKNDSKEDGYSFLLTPKSAFVRRFFEKAEVDFNKKTGLPTRVRQIKLSGQDITITFTNEQLNPPVDSKLFDSASLSKTEKK